MIFVLTSDLKDKPRLDIPALVAICAAVWIQMDLRMESIARHIARELRAIAYKYVLVVSTDYQGAYAYPSPLCYKHLTTSKCRSAPR
ncbi:hypothetical protein AG1IA_00679 [Rhizoctonia solani AG-1 IA]|uniref:Uncharacterized protein n=1 Tax=Thanatephorus cucumeris (strain AG1-IA) TaxID=983506 RepID=L8X876_THACA|nr:hypothetical protein AG1IA_00679 [Rhizoctonia solani AG-1 IA]